MHTIHYFAVEAQDKEEAFEIVQTRLSSEDGDKFVDWSDWHVVGGGRWSDSQYEDTSSTTISYAENPEKFLEILSNIKKWRIEEMNRMLAQIDTDKFKSDIVDYISNNAIPDNEQRFGSLNSYYIKSAADMIQDYYTPDSHFYDLAEYTAHIGYINDRLDDKDKSALQYLVPVDFHY
jgi:hypothetical protein